MRMALGATLAILTAGCMAALAPSDASGGETTRPVVAVAASATPAPPPSRTPAMPSPPTPTPASPLPEDARRFGDVALSLAPEWLSRSPDPAAPAMRVAALFQAQPRYGSAPTGRLYRVPGATDVRSIVAATAPVPEDAHAFDETGALRPHRLEDVTLDGVAGRMSWTIRQLEGDVDPKANAYVRRDVAVVRAGVGYRLVLDMWFGGDEHLAHAFGLETQAIVASWRWVR